MFQELAIYVKMQLKFTNIILYNYTKMCKQGLQHKVYKAILT